jgi:UDP-N-acetylglucosamine--N-acetylmuramyl-(pentapeptide) pyrophosphoryl-undecaprenol N-acetylglucosamine transferase
LDGVVVGPTLSKPLIKPWNGGYILVSGGTHGHKLLFDALSETNIKNIVLQTGAVNPTPYMKKHPEWKVIAFTKEFHELLAGAELVVSHFGSTVLDAVVYGKPVVLVLNPALTRSVGIEDAEHLANKVNAVLVSEINMKTILQSIDEARKRKIPALPNGAKNLANIIVKICQGSRRVELANHLCAHNASIPIQ